MPSLTRPLTGPNLTFDLRKQLEQLRADDAYERSGRAGRTLAKHGSLRLTLTVLRKGAEVGTHHAEAPMTLHPLEGSLRYRVGDEECSIQAGQILYFGPGHAQDIRALEDTALLLTISTEAREEGSDRSD